MTEKDLEIQQLRRENADIRRECDELIRACERRSTEADKWHRMYDEEKTRTEALTRQRDLALQSHAEMCEKAEQLEKERDAAVDDLRLVANNCFEDYVFSACCCCKKNDTCNGQPATGCEFEWRGVQEADDERT